MEIKVSELIGFCFGVKKAVDLSNNALSKKSGRIFSAGPLIHNPQAVEELSRKGLTPVDDIESLCEGTVIISSHGKGAKLLASAKGGNGKPGLEIIDATCPFVKNIQRHVKRLYEEGYKVVIIGKKEHPEVKALTDFADGKAVVIKDVNEAKKIGIKRFKIGIVSQSTYSQSAFLEIVSILLEKPFSEIRVFNTICTDTTKRQDSVRRLANLVDVVIVIGGKNSSNTCRLFEVCKKEGKAAHHIEDSSQVRPSWFAGKKSVGIASGASTPDWVVQDVIKKIRRYS